MTLPAAPLAVGVDGSANSLRAVDWAADEAVLRGVPLRVVHASSWERYESATLADREEGERGAGDRAGGDPNSPNRGSRDDWGQDGRGRDGGDRNGGSRHAEGLGEPGRDTPSEQAIADRVIAAAARRARQRHPGLRVSAEVLAEEPEYALVRESRHATALVLGGARGGLVEKLLGSVGLIVAAHTHCPLIVVRGDHPGGSGHVVVGVGAPGADPAALRFAAEEARLRAVPLDAVRAWRSPAYEGASRHHPPAAEPPGRERHEESAAERLAAALADVPPEVDLRRHTVEGAARGVLLDASQDAALLVVGARRETGRPGLRLGRVAHGLLHRSACPVALVPERT